MSATGTCSDEALDDDRIDYLIRDARASVLSSSDVADELESVGLDLVAGERIADAAIEDAVASFGEDLAGIAELKAELQAADAALKAESTTPRLVVYPAVLVLLAMIGLSGLTIVGLGGLAVTAIEGHGRWILPWFGLHSALIGIAICVALFSLLGLLLTRQERRTAASPGARRVSSLESQISAKQKTIREILTQEWIRPAIREAVNRAREPSWSTELTLRSAEGLGQPLNPQLEIDTAVRHAVERRLTLWSGGSIGIAGPRGVGKSTLIETLCRSEPQEDGRKRLGVIVAAPVSYEPRDFILYLFATVCEKVLETYELPAPKLVDLIAEPVAARKGNQMTLSSFMRRLAQVTFEVVTVNTSVTVGRRVQPPPYTPAGVGDTAGELLQEIRFQQTFTAGWGGSLSSPIGFKLDRGQSFARASMTLPEVVTRLREFLEQLGVEHQVVVGIDELDKIAGEVEAQRFLNDIKAIFAARNCFFILSVSEDAMSSFERRGLPIRDAIDSALDDVVGIEYFDCPKSTALLGGRVVGLPQPFIVFCHVIGGGLPRDVLRVARRLAELSSIAAERSLSDVVKRFASEELTRKQAAVRIVTRGLTDSWAAAGREVVRVLEGADGLNHAGIGSACRALRLGTHVGADGPSGAAAQELVAYAYFLVTVVDLFQSSTVADVLRPAVEEREGGSSIETLACARQAFALDLRGAWALVSRFRRSWGWPTIEFPTAPRIDFSGKPTG